jgi:hypothetical protein
MRLFKYLFISLLVISSTYAYVDEDIDGVDDSIDKCLNTPFDALADEDGCAVGQKKNSTKLTLKIGTTTSFDDTSDSDTNLNYYIGYRYNNYDFSLSSSNYTSYDNSSKTGDLYVSGGYTFKNKQSDTKFSLGVKLANADDDVGTGENDYFASIFFDYFINHKQDLFLYYSYTISGDSDIDYEDFLSFSIGSGVAITNKWYSSISYDYSGSRYRDSEDYRAISWFNTYSFSKNFFTTLNYSYGLDDLSYDHTITLKFGVNF